MTFYCFRSCTFKCPVTCRKTEMFASTPKSEVLNFYEFSRKTFTFASSAVNLGFFSPVENKTCPTAFSMTLKLVSSNKKLRFPNTYKASFVKPQTMSRRTSLIHTNAIYTFLTVRRINFF